MKQLFYSACLFQKVLYKISIGAEFVVAESVVGNVMTDILTKTLSIPFLTCFLSACQTVVQTIEC